ncbi:MAG: hypothetical protein AAF682_13270 [Planctomycetota bacterium]
MTRSALPFHPTLGAACRGAVGALTLAAAPLAQGEGGLDLVPVTVIPNQAIQTGNTLLVAGRSTFVRVPVRGLGTIGKGVVYDGVMRVYDNGLEVPGSPFYSMNGPLVPVPQPDPNELDGTLNFVFVPPESDAVEMVVEINPAGATQVAETDYTNNVVTSGPRDFVCKAVPQVTFVPIDYQPSGGGSNPPDWDLIKPGAGDNFLQGIYPVPDWEYQRTDAPTKLWTSSVSSSSGGVQLAQALANDMLLMNPVPDYIYGWIPGALPGYNGVALSVPGVAAIGNTQPIRHQRTFAHELGHLFGLGHNTSTINEVGIDVEHHLNITESLPQLKPTSHKDIMFAGLLTEEAWVRESNYQFFSNNGNLLCTGDAADDAGGSRLIVSGLFDHDARSLELTDTLVIEGGRASAFHPVESADVVLRAYDGETLLAELGVSTRSSADSCPGCGAAPKDEATADAAGGVTPLGGFAAALPSAVDPDAVDRVELSHGPSGTPLGTLRRSASAPEIAAFAVSEGRASWDASDADGDALSFYLRYSPDGTRLVPVHSGLAADQASFDPAALAPPQSGAYFELLATDGLNTTTVRHALTADGGGGTQPWIQVLSPDPGFTFPAGATVILHSSGWDVEDRALTGAAITWASDVDGDLGDGRVHFANDLSVGTHVITGTATDSSLSSSSHSVTIEITPRELPGEVCQPDLGFGGPGGSLLEVCGGDLSSGTTAAVTLSGAAPSAPLWLLVSFSQNPTSLYGGTVVPFPATLVLADTTGADGNWTAPDPVVGGGGPLTLFLQAAYLDDGFPEGVGFSNAVQVEVLP